MSHRRGRPAFTLVNLLVLIAIMALAAGLLLPAIRKARIASERTASLSNLRQLVLALHSYTDVHKGQLPTGSDKNHFSVQYHILPYIEQGDLFKSDKIDRKKDASDPANAKVGRTLIKTFVSPRDPLQVGEGAGGTNYWFNAGTKPGIKDNDGVFFQDSTSAFPRSFPDGTSNTIMVVETLRGDGGTEAASVARQHVRLKAADLKGAKDDAGVQEFKDGKNIVGDRGTNWLDGRILQTLHTATRLPNDARPDVDFGGAGGSSAARSLDDSILVGMADGSVRATSAAKMKMALWKALHTPAGGEAIEDF